MEVVLVEPAKTIDLRKEAIKESIAMCRQSQDHENTEEMRGKDLANNPISCSFSSSLRAPSHTETF